MEDDGQEAKDVSLGASVLVPPVKENPNFVVDQTLSSLTLQTTNFFIQKY